jgi:NADP-dependent 3-hydroxy acid dehydrogenase YdfG
VWITGASSGIGENIALALARAGVKLVLSARRENELKRVKQNCVREYVYIKLELQVCNNTKESIHIWRNLKSLCCQ